jgi:galactokinase/mevalonate kinase-like predicted kinase
MSNHLIETITSEDEFLRNRSIESLLHGSQFRELLNFADELESFRRSSKNLYHKVRASLFLYEIFRFYLVKDSAVKPHGIIPFEGVKAAFERDFEKSLEIYLTKIKGNNNYNCSIFSAVAGTYYKLSFKYLLDQVKLSMSQCIENHEIYNINGLADYPFTVSSLMTTPDPSTGLYPVGMDASPVRLDPSHSGWSDIFFLGMDFPEGARIVNMSVNLRIHDSNGTVLPPCECYCRYIEEPVIHLNSIDLKTSKKVSTLDELFNFGNDYLSLLKAGVVASGIVPPCFENIDIPLPEILKKLLGKQGGIEIVTRVNGIPKGSRLAVSTTLLSAIITRLMRFSNQIKEQTGKLAEGDRRVVAARAILGEWLGGSGGGWQDSGGLWPGIKVITGQLAREGHPEFGISRGCLLPIHNIFNRDEINEDIERCILNSMVIVHGGISQDVGPILEMVTEKYLLKHEKEWNARIKGITLFDEIVEALKSGKMKELGRLTTQDWEDAIQIIIPWVNNAFTEDLIRTVKDEFAHRYWGFLMLGGMSGGGMAFIVDPDIKDKFKNRVSIAMKQLKDKYSTSLPFIIDPVVYDFEINHDGIVSYMLTGSEAIIPETDSFSSDKKISTEIMTDKMDEHEIKIKYGFNMDSHEHVRDLLKRGEIGLAKNRLPIKTVIEDVHYEDIQHIESEGRNDFEKTGEETLHNNEVAVVTFAGGMGSRWTHGAAVVKPVNPFININGRYRTFMEIHLAKSRKSSSLYDISVPHVFTTSYLTHNAISKYLEDFDYFGCRDHVYLSQGKSIGHRVYPVERDLRFYWEEQLQQKMEDNVQKVQDDIHSALIAWAKERGEGEDYRENHPVLRFNPPGHWYEIPNLLKNGVLADLLNRYPDLKYLLCHNIDTLGVSIDPRLLGMHLAKNSCMSFEVTPRRIEDAGGGLAKVNGHIQLIEGLAMPREEDEYNLSYYNTLTNWITIDCMLDFFGLDRDIITDAQRDETKYTLVVDAIHAVEKRIPVYVTIKDVRYIWGSGQEDVYPVAQFERLWGDMTGLKDLKVDYVSVSRFRGQQLKEPGLLDAWVHDGSLDYVKDRCSFE